MTEIFTRVELPKCQGFMDRGRRTRQEMIDRLRKIATKRAEESAAILAASDEDFKVAVVRGCHVQHMIEELKP